MRWGDGREGEKKRSIGKRTDQEGKKEDEREEEWKIDWEGSEDEDRCVFPTETG